MKIVTWNLKNIGHGKLTKPMNPTIANAGYGSTVLQFMMNVVMGSNVWNGTNLTAVPADVFLVIELKSGGSNKGGAVTGTGVPCMANLVNAMNTVVAVTPSLQGLYHYAQTPGMVIGHHESVGLIYNTLALTFVGEQVVQDNLNHYVLPRTPYLAQFTELAGGAAVNIVGIHAPPPGGGAALQFKKPIFFCNRLPACPNLMAGAPHNYFIGGDFNCAPNSTWTCNGVALTPFHNPAPPAPAGKTLTGYTTVLPNGTLTSVRRKLNNAAVGQAQYLKGAYDNVLQFPNNIAFLSYALDLVGNIVAGVGLVAKLNNFWNVSDHLPVATVSLPAPQAIRFTPLPAAATYPGAGPLVLSAASSSGLPVAFAVAGPGAIAANVLTITGAGNVAVSATQAGNGTFTAATPIVQNIHVT